MTNPILGYHRGCARKGGTSGTAHHHRGGARHELKLGRVHRLKRVGNRHGSGIEGCSSGVVCENHLVGPGFSEGMPTHTGTHAHTRFEYPFGSQA